MAPEHQPTAVTGLCDVGVIPGRRVGATSAHPSTHVDAEGAVIRAVTGRDNAVGAASRARQRCLVTAVGPNLIIQIGRTHGNRL